MRSSLLSPALAVCLCAAAGAAPAPDFDQGVDPRPVLEAARAAPSPPVPGAPQDAVWVGLAKADLQSLRAEFAFARGVAAASSEQAAVFQAREDDLDRLSAFFHEKLRRRGGFFAYRSLSAARGAMTRRAPAPGAGGYTIDQAARVEPALRLVDEAAAARTIAKLSGYKNRHYKSETGVAAARWVKDHWADLARARPDVEVELRAHEGWPQPSVVLTIPGGRLAGETVVLGGHLDTPSGGSGGSPGADDNASGVAVVTEALRVLLASDYRPARTLQAIAFSAEEVGLRGSQDIAEAYQAEGRRVAAVVQFDMAGYQGSAADVYLISDHTDAGLSAFIGRLVERYGGLRWDKTDCGYACSDHASWTAAGFPTAYPFEAKNGEDNPNIHSTRDTLAAMGGAAHAAKFARLAAAAAVELAK